MYWYLQNSVLSVGGTSPYCTCNVLVHTVRTMVPVVLLGTCAGS